MRHLASDLLRFLLSSYATWAVWAHALLLLAITWLAFVLYGGEP